MTQAKEEVVRSIENVKEALQLENIQSTAINPVLHQWAAFIGFLPKIITAGIGLVIGYILSRVTASLLRRMGIDRLGRAAVSWPIIWWRGFMREIALNRVGRLALRVITANWWRCRAQNTVLEQENGERISIPNSQLFQHAVTSSGPSDSSQH